MNNYTPPFFLFNAHLETIFPALIRRVSGVNYERERIATPDDDFLDLDWQRQSSRKVVIISHGLEGNTLRGYMLGMSKAFFGAGFDTLAWNYRGCGQEVNRQRRFYHSGATDDLDCVVSHVAAQNAYDEIYLVGFSLGGNITLKYLGEQKRNSQIKKAVAISVPLNLHSSCEKISAPGNRVYASRFLKSLKKKVKDKAAARNDIDVSGIDLIKTLREFDDRYTAPLHGFKDALHYYQQCSSIGFIDTITIPTLIINAQNDPFLASDCYPVEMLKGHRYVTFENPDHGGHVGFSRLNKNGLYWSESRAVEFITSSY